MTPSAPPVVAEVDLPADVAELISAADAEADAAADRLHDGPVQALVVAHYAAEAAARGGDPVAAREAVRAALVELRRFLWHLRPRSENGLPEALQMLSARLEEAGRPPLGLCVDEELAAGLPPAVVSTAYRLVQSLAVPPDADPVLVTLRSEGSSVVLDVEGGSGMTDVDRWAGQARVLGGSLTATGTHVRLAVPLAPTTRSKATP